VRSHELGKVMTSQELEQRLRDELREYIGMPNTPETRDKIVEHILAFARSWKTSCR
jgi:hypothetical protein